MAHISELGGILYMDIGKAKRLDDILKRFSGNITVSWDSLREEFKDDMNKYYILENNINFLVGDGILKRDNTLHTLCMTDKGFATMTDPENLGYYVKAKKERNESRIKYAAFFITTATFLILLFNNFINPQNTSSNETPPEKVGKTAIADTLQKQTEDSQNHSFDTVIVNNKKTFAIKTRDLNEDDISLTANSTLLDTIDRRGFSYIEFIDLNKDSNKDILICYYGNNATYELFIFDPVSNSFKWLEDFMNYPDAVQLRSYPEFYYSYHRAGCADMNWVSDLFKIENFKAIQIGSIYGKGCEDEPQEIEISKIIDNDEEKAKLLKKLPYSKHITNFCDKWTFIEKYWNENYSLFK